MHRGPDRIFDEYLVVMSQGGSREALATLVRRWSPRLQRYCARLLRSQELGEDVLQDVWISAWPSACTMPRISVSKRSRPFSTSRRAR